MNKHLNRIIVLAVVLTLTASTPLKKVNESPDLGKYSMSLNVSDLSASKDFYEKLGFQPVEGLGSLKQMWMVVSNGHENIGLFQGMFPTNTMTFNVEDGRGTLQTIKDNGIEANLITGKDTSAGPCSFLITDPDGNPIIVDQLK
ncbi:MAG: VOC family protein [Bacteroidia bacterium]|nr:VOC family protein [Bacteroidia bacterium]